MVIQLSPTTQARVSHQVAMVATTHTVIRAHPATPNPTPPIRATVHRVPIINTATHTRALLAIAKIPRLATLVLLRATDTRALQATARVISRFTLALIRAMMATVPQLPRATRASAVTLNLMKATTAINLLLKVNMASATKVPRVTANPTAAIQATALIQLRTIKATGIRAFQATVSRILVMEVMVHLLTAITASAI